MPAIEIRTVMNDQKPAGTNTALPGKILAGSSKSVPLNDFLGMMQMTMAEYQNQSRTEENLATGYDDNQMGKIFLIKNDYPPQDNGKSKRSEGNAYRGEMATMPADENSTTALDETIAAPFIGAFIIDKMITGSKTVGADETGAEAFLAIQKEGKKGLVGLKELLLNATADDIGKQNKDILASLAKENQPLTEANLNTTPEMKNRLVMALEGKGIPVDAIDGILKAVEQASGRIITENAPVERQNFKELDQVIMAMVPGAQQDTTGKYPVRVERTLPTLSQFEQTAVAILEKKGFSAEDIKGILKAVEQASGRIITKNAPVERQNFKELDQVIMAMVPGARQDTTGKYPVRVEQTLPTLSQFEQAAVAILEKKGFSAEDIKGILKAVEQATGQIITKNAPVERQNFKELDQVIMAMVPGAQQDTTGKYPVRVEQTLPTLSQFEQAAVAILEKKGFSAEDIKGILKAVEQATIGGLKPDVPPRSDQPLLVQQSLYNKEFMKEATFGKKKIHVDIYQKELIEQPENNQQSEKKNIFPGAVKGTENKQPIFNDKDINAPQTGKIITATDQDDQGKWSKLSGDVTIKTSQARHEDISLSADREQSPLTSNMLSMTAKGADFHNGKTTMDTSKSIYQSVLDQVRDSFSIAQNKDNGQVRVTLKPEIMGHLDMQITVRNETVQIMMTVENEKVHQAMNAHIDDLKTALQNQGMKIDKIEVALQYKPDQERTFHQDKANSGFDNPGQNTRHERMLNKELFTGNEHYPKSGQDIIKTQNSMQGVSVFA